MEKNYVYVFCFRGIEIHKTPFIMVFSNQKSAESQIGEMAKIYECEVKSEMGWDDHYSYNDWRLQDKQGNSYYIIIEKRLILS